jgi:hypothetical protein
VCYGKRKLSQLLASSVEYAASALGVDHKELNPNNCDVPCSNCSDLDALVESMKVKCALSSRYKQQQILTLAPESWSLRRISEEFGVSERLAKQSRKLKKEFGILSEPQPKQGRNLSTDTIASVQRFYEDDEISRACPGMRDVVTVRIDGIKVQKQKRLQLCNLNEAYVEFKKLYPDVKIGRSKFCELRPRWCVSVGPQSTHTVCVCEIHQNVKLLVAAMGQKALDYHQLINMIVCSDQSRDCILHGCERCPDKATLSEFVTKLFHSKGMDSDDNIKFLQWVHTDRTTLVSTEMLVEDYIDHLSEKMGSLTKHDFIAKAQAASSKLQK